MNNRLSVEDLAIVVQGQKDGTKLEGTKQVYMSKMKVMTGILNSIYVIWGRRLKSIR